MSDVPTRLDLDGGRSLELRITGPEQGVPLLFHHGTPGAARPMRALERAVHDAGFRFVCWSRPGYAGSSRQPGRRVADVAADATAVLDRLRADRCVTIGWSGGGPHALALAALLPDRVAGASLLAGVAPYGLDDLDYLAGMGEQNIEEFGLSLEGESALRPWLEEQVPELREVTPAGVVDSMSSLLPEVDRAVLTDEFGEDLAAQMGAAVSTGVDGWLDDDLAFVSEWGFDPAAVSVPVFVWQGDQDLMVPFAHGQWLAAAIPGATAHLHPGEGHLSVVIGRIEAIVVELAALG